MRPIQITAKDVAHKDPKYLREKIIERITEYNRSNYESRGELLTEIQILTNRIDSIHSERVEKRSLFLERVVVVLIACEIVIGGVGYIDGRAQQRALQAIESNTRATSKAREKQYQPPPGKSGRVKIANAGCLGLACFPFQLMRELPSEYFNGCDPFCMGPA